MDDLEWSLSVILNLYDKLLPGCKPRDDEYSVLAGIVARVHGENPTVIALATGTKCIGRDFNNANGCLLSDSHAEVVVRRAFICYLYNQIHRVLDSVETSAELEDCCITIKPHTLINGKQPVFTISDGWEFILYVSDSPCGDAAMYEANLAGETKIVTGAKICSQNCEAPGCLRTKSGRSDISQETRTTSMSCSDKISRWSCLGLQGSLLTAWLAPVYLSTVMIDRDPLAVVGAQDRAAQRALVERLQQPLLGNNNTSRTRAVTETTDPHCFGVHYPSVQVLNSELFYSHGKAMSKQRFPALIPAGAADSSAASAEEPARKKVKKNPLSPCGFSLNWYLGADYVEPGRTDADLSDAGAVKPKVKSEKRLPTIAGGTLEVTIAHTGALQGSTKKSAGEAPAASRLSRHRMRGRFESLLHRCVHSTSSSSSSRDACAQLAQRMCEALLPGLPFGRSTAVLATGAGAERKTAVACGSMEPDPASSSAIVGNSCPDCPESVFEKSLLLQYVQRASLQDLKKLCGKREYAEKKEMFLSSPLFKDWLSDDA